MNQEQINADIAYESISKNKKALAILREVSLTTSIAKKEELRDQLYNLLINKYEILKKRGILQYHFVLPDNTSFLRFHKKSRYGDNLADTRLDFKYVNDTKKIIRGFAQGRVAHAFRNVYPLFDENKNYLCAVEVSFSSEFLQDNLTNVSNIHTHFLINKNIFEAKTWERDDLVVKYNQSLEDENYMISMPITKKNFYIYNMSKKIPKIKEKISKNISLNKEFSIYYTQDNGKIEVVSFLPIENNTNHSVVAWIVSYEEDSLISIALRNTLYVRIILFSILVLLFYFIYRTLNQTYILKDTVKAKTNDLKELNENLEQKIIVEVAKSKEIELKLFQADKMASMGEMIGNIAHQWRQPLSAISTSATGMKMKKEYGLLTDDDFYKDCDNIDKHAQYLSQTIDDFRNYIKGNRDKKIFTLKNDVESFLHLIEGSLKKEDIKLIDNIDRKITIDGYPNELVQCFINLYNNSKDAFQEHNIEQRYIIISSELEKETIKIYFKDNAFGIQDNIISKVFDPYFTTRHKSQGTGLGLHMTYRLIVEGMSGNIEVNNRTFDYKDKIYTGAEFIITLPR